MKYDAFISHRSDDKPWVRTLATNLQKAGLSVFLDEWELVPGDSFVAALEQGLENSAGGALVCTPGALESGWVRAEYDRMIARRASRGDGFRLVPVVLDPCAPKFPFLESVHHVDFSQPDRYRESFQRLLCGLNGEPPGPSPWFEGDLETADYSRYAAPLANGLLEPARAWVEQVFEALYSRRAVVMPAPEDRLDGRQTALIRQQAEVEFGADRFLHIGPPTGNGKRLTKAQRQEYFQILGQQCGFEDRITGGRDFADAVASRVRRGQLLLLISRFDHGHPDACVELATNVRQLLETQHGLHVILTGGEDLSDLYFVTAEHSLINHAEYLVCPEMTRADVRAMVSQLHPAVPLSDEDLDAIYAASGGLPRLVERCVRFLGEAGFDRAAAEDGIARSPEIWKKILPLAQEEASRKRLAELLHNDDVGPALTYLVDPLQRRLYWSGLLRPSTDQRRLVWRCPAIREAGRTILGTS